MELEEVSTQRWNFWFVTLPSGSGIVVKMLVVVVPSHAFLRFFPLIIEVIMAVVALRCEWLQMVVMLRSESDLFGMHRRVEEKIKNKNIANGESELSDSPAPYTSCKEQ